MLELSEFARDRLGSDHARCKREEATESALLKALTILCSGDGDSSGAEAPDDTTSWPNARDRASRIFEEAIRFFTTIRRGDEVQMRGSMYR